MNEKGATLVWMTIVILIVIGFAAITIDVAMIRDKQSQIQKAADAAALGGVAVMPDGNAATSLALYLADQNNYSNDDIDTDVDIVLSYSRPYTCKVTISHKTAFWFAPVLGYKNGMIKISATAASYTSLSGLKYGAFPFALINPNANTDPCDDLIDLNYGKRYIVGYGPPNIMVEDWANGCGAVPETPAGSNNAKGWRGALDLDDSGELGGGGSDLKYNIANGWPGSMDRNDYIPSQTGNLSGPITQGREARLNKTSLQWIDFDTIKHRRDWRVIFVPIVDLINVYSRNPYTVADFEAGVPWDHSEVLVVGFAPFFILSEEEQGDVDGDGNFNDGDWITGYFVPGVQIPQDMGAHGEPPDYGLYSLPRLVR